MPGSTAIPPHERGVDKSGACFEVEVTFVRVKARAVFVIACLALVVGFGAGCTAAPSSSPDPTTVFSNEQEAFAAAEETYRAYVDALNQVDLSDPTTFEGVYAWTTGELNSGDRKDFTAMHADGFEMRGQLAVGNLHRVSAQLDPLVVELEACFLVGDLVIVDGDGQSTAEVDRSPIQRLHLILRESESSTTRLVLDSVRPGEPDLQC